MGKRDREESPRRGRRPAFLQPFTAVYRRLAGNCDGAHSGASASIDDGVSGIAATAGPCDTLASELLARLLLELPGHRRDLLSAYQAGNGDELARATHKLLGGVVYCKLPDLAAALRDLKGTLGVGDAGQTGAALGKAILMIDELLALSGYRSG